LSIPAGKSVDEVLFSNEGIVNLLDKNDVILDGGNSFYKDSIRRAKKLKKKSIQFIDVGVSGGPAGARYGASLMIGGEKKLFEQYEQLFFDLAEPEGYQFFNGYGAGHFVKMIHNGIEYGMMQAIAEGFSILKKAPYKLDVSKITQVYNQGSVIESKLIAWLHNAFILHGDDLKNVSSSVGYTGEGEWTVQTAREMKIKTKIIEESLKFRVQSKKNPSYTGKILSALREQFGGHRG
jgi:6-phosphogluconate dehydrogenase